MVGKLIGEGVKVYLRFDCTGLKQSFDLGCEKQISLIVVDVIKRLDPHSVAGDEKLTFRFVPDRKGKHAPQILDAIASVGFVQMQDRLGVAAVLKFVAASDEIFAMVGVVIDLAVINDRASAVAVKHRLRSVGDIDDAQAPVAETDVAIDINAPVIRPAMMQNVAHRDQPLFINLSSGSWGIRYAVNTAHILVSTARFSGG